MNKVNALAVFGILFLSSILLAYGEYPTSQIFAEENQTGTENEAEVKADIEQENTCAKDTECENENKINNSLTIVNNGTSQQTKTETPTCQTCFTNNLTPEEIISLGNAWTSGTGGEINSIEEFCTYIEQNGADPQVIQGLLAKGGFIAEINEDTINTIADCLEEFFGITIPPPFDN